MLRFESFEPLRLNSFESGSMSLDRTLVEEDDDADATELLLLAILFGLVLVFELWFPTKALVQC